MPEPEALASIGEAPYATTTHPFNSSRQTWDGENYVDHNANI